VDSRSSDVQNLLALVREIFPEQLMIVGRLRDALRWEIAAEVCRLLDHASNRPKQGLLGLPQV
jgi:hypothetical protein